MLYYNQDNVVVVDTRNEYWHLTDIVYYDYRDAFAAKKSFLVQKYLKYC